MGIKQYIIAALILIAIIGGYVFSFEAGDYTFKVLDKSFTFPIAFWSVVPAFVLFIATLVHMFYHGTIGFFQARSIQKDNENLTTLVGKKLLNESSNALFKNTDTKELADILSQLDITVTNSNFSTSNKEMSAIVENVLQINAGKYVSSKQLKLANDNPLMEKNLRNRIDLDDNFALEVIKQPSLYTHDVLKYAFIKVTQTKSMTTIKKLLEDIVLDADMLKALVEKDSEEHNEFSLTNTQLVEMIKKATDITNKDLLFVAKQYKKTATPEQLIKLFEDLASLNEKYTESYLYILAQYEMIDDIREILVNSQKDEFKIYKAFLDLRDAGKHYSLDTFV